MIHIVGIVGSQNSQAAITGIDIDIIGEKVTFGCLTFSLSRFLLAFSCSVGNSH